MRPRYNDDIKLMVPDTDNLIYLIQNEDFYKDMYEIRQFFDLSEYSKSNPIYDETHKHSIGKLKDETGDKVIETFV